MASIFAADAIILAGGRGSRMGGVDKPALRIAGRSLLDVALAATAGCARVVVAGPPRAELPRNVIQVQEAPAGAGPVAAIAAGLAALEPGSEFTAIVAADLPFLAPETLTELVRACAGSTADAVFAEDAVGRPQYLVSVWRQRALRAALNRLDTVINQPMKAIVPVDILLIPLTGVTDVDTPDDVRAAIQQQACLTVAQAREALHTSLTALPPRERALRAGRGGALAEQLLATGPLPRFDVAAMDGYAVAGPGPWTVRADTGYAGGARPRGLAPGDAVRIATGAHVPAGTSTVIRDEFVQVKANILHRVPGSPDRDDVRRQGEDFTPGMLVAEAGTPITPALISAALSVESTTAFMRGPVRAHVVVTGDEIRTTGPLHPGQTRDSIGPVIADFLTWNNIELGSLVHLRDSRRGFSDLLHAGPDADVLIVIGATGAGAADQLRLALAQASAQFMVPRLSLRPGGSALVAQLPEGPVTLGLPGNPFAAITALSVLAPALVAALTARPLPVPATGIVVNAAECSGPVTRAVAVQQTPDGQWIADTATRTAHLAGLINRPALALIPPNATDRDPAELLFLPS